MTPEDEDRITTAVDYWIKSKAHQLATSQREGRAQEGTRGAVTGGKHLAGLNDLIVDQLARLGLGDVDLYFDRQATLPGYYRTSKSWDLLAMRDDVPLLAVEYKSMQGSEGRNLNNRADEVFGIALDLQRAKDTGLVHPELKLAYIFMMEATPAVQRGVRARVTVGQPDPVFENATYLDRMTIMCERLRDDHVYDMAWALAINRDPSRFYEPLPTVGWDRFAADLEEASFEWHQATELPRGW